MNNKLQQTLNNTRKNLYDVCRELGIDPQLVDLELLDLDQCSHCGIWLNYNKLLPDLDKNPICRYCLDLAGM